MLLSVLCSLFSCSRFSVLCSRALGSRALCSLFSVLYSLFSVLVLSVLVLFVLCSLFSVLCSLFFVLVLCSLFFVLVLCSLFLCSLFSVLCSLFFVLCLRQPPPPLCFLAPDQPDCNSRCASGKPLFKPSPLEMLHMPTIVNMCFIEG